MCFVPATGVERLPTSRYQRVWGTGLECGEAQIAARGSLFLADGAISSRRALASKRLAKEEIALGAEWLGTAKVDDSGFD